jgi:hypothetical protein
MSVGLCVHVIPHNPTGVVDPRSESAKTPRDINNFERNGSERVNSPQKTTSALAVGVHSHDLASVVDPHGCSSDAAGDVNEAERVLG